MKKLLIATLFVWLSACVSLPDNVTPVNDFQLDRYLGKWYEIARLDHSFERGLSQVSAEYSLRDDGGVRVLNRGYNAEKAQWQEAEGKAYFVDAPDTGFLKVSFFGPFYGAYVVFELDKDGYQHAFVSGPNKKYLWLLSRTPEVDDELKQRFLKQSKSRGFDTNSLIFVEQEKELE